MRHRLLWPFQKLERMYLKTPYPIKRGPAWIIIGIVWTFIGLALWYNPLPLTMIPTVIDEANRSDAHFWTAGAVILTGVAMILGSIGSWFCEAGRFTWWAATGAACTQSFIFFISSAATIVLDKEVFPQVVWALLGWSLLTGMFFLCMFHIKRIIFDGEYRGE